MTKRLFVILFFLLATLGNISAQGWERLYGTAKTDTPTGLTATSDGGFLLCGYTIEATTNKQDILLVKTDAEGQQLWIRNIGKQNINERAYSVIQNPDGTYIVVGVAYTDSLDTDASVYIVKLNARGDTLWTKKPSPTNYCSDAAYDVRRLRDGSGYILSGLACRQGLPFKDDIGLLKIDNNGNTVWQKTFGDDQNFEFTHKVIETADKGFVVAGVRGLYGVDSQRVMIVKFDQNGIVAWSKFLGAKTLNDCTDVIADNEGGVFATGVLTLETGELVSFLKKIAADGHEVWSKTYSDFLWSYHVSRTDDGGFKLVTGNYAGQRLSEWIKTDSLGNQLVRKKIYSFNKTDELVWVVPTPDKGLALLSGRTVNNNRDYHLLKLDSLGAMSANTISGKIFIDQNQNCRFDTPEPALGDWLVKAESGNKVLWGFTDSLGHYQIGVDSSNYMVSLVKPNRYWSPCRDSLFVGLNSNYPNETIDFAVKPSTNCPLLEVDVATPLLRRCFENTYYVRYCNRGTATSRGGSVRVVLDKYLTFNSSSIPLSTRRGDTLFFNVPNLQTNQCGEFSFRSTVRCDSTFTGQTHCVEAHIFPDSICIPTAGWSGASIQVSGACQRDSVVFFIKNVGSAATSQPVRYSIVEDDIIFINDAVSIPQGGSQNIKLPATGQTYRLIAQQEPNHPSADRFATAAVEGCRLTALTPLSIGFVSHFSENDGDPFVSIDCHQNSGSFDPNDKQAQPQGIGSQHFVDEEAELDYTIRFQNTGTDTAFTVVVRDTLSPLLDVTSVHLGASSHKFDFEIIEGKALKFSFRNINLPDSFHNALASQGFLKFNIKLKKGIPFNSKINNRAAIFFDFNTPIFTNQTFHTLRKPEHYSSKTVQLCDNQTFNGKVYAVDTRVYDTLRLAKFDSIIINAMHILPTFKKTIDTTLRRGQTINGIAYQRDTSITVKYAAKTGCDSTITFKLKIVTATQELTNGLMKIYPNPFSDQTTIELPPQYQGNFELNVYDSTGRLLETKTVSDNKFIINRGLLTQGIYFFTISSNKLIITLGKLLVTD